MATAASKYKKAVDRIIQQHGTSYSPPSPQPVSKPIVKQTSAAMSTPQTAQEVIDVIQGERPVVVPTNTPVQVASKVETREPVYTPVHEKTETLTKQQFTQETYQAQQDIERQKTEILNIPPVNPVYHYTTTTDTGIKKFISGFEAAAIQQQQKTEAIKSLNEASTSYQKLWQQSLEWHPETTIAKRPSGKYEVKFPYAGAESYRTYKRALESQPVLSLGAVFGPAGFLVSELGGKTTTGRYRIGLPTGLFATALTPEDPLGFASAAYMMGGDKQKAIDVKIKSMYRVSTIKDPLSFAGWTFEMPTTQIMLAAAGGYGIGKASGYAAGRLSASILGTRALQYGGLALGTALTVPAAIDIKSTFERGEYGEAYGKIGVMGFSFASGAAGYKAGMASTSGVFGKGKGLTTYEMGAKKAYLSSLNKMYKTGDIDVIQFSRGSKAVKAYYKIKQDIRIRGLKPFQSEITLENVQSLEKTPLLKEWFKKQPISRRSEIFGGAASDKPITHDIDIMYRSALGAAETKQASLIMKYGKASQYADIKPWMRTGKIITKFGTVKQPSYHYESGLRGMQFTEQFMRLGESSLELAHAGRTKDISEAIRMMDLIYTRTGGIPTSMSKTIESYRFAMTGLEKTPIIMKATTSQYFFGSGFSKKFYETRVSLYEKIMPSSYYKGQVQKYMGTLKTGTTYTGDYLPPSVSISLVPSSMLGGLTSTIYYNPSKIISSNIKISSPSISSSSAINKLITIPSSTTKKSISISKSITKYYTPVSPYKTVFKTSPSKLPSISIKPAPSSYIIPVISPSYSPYKTPSSYKPPSSITKAITSYMPSSKTMKSIYYIPPSPYKLGLRGGGTMGGLGTKKDPFYKFRMFKMPSIKDILGSVKI